MLKYTGDQKTIDKRPHYDIEIAVKCANCKKRDGTWCNELERAVNLYDFCSRGALMDGKDDKRDSKN